MKSHNFLEKEKINNFDHIIEIIDTCAGAFRFQHGTSQIILESLFLEILASKLISNEFVRDIKVIID